MPLRRILPITDPLLGMVSEPVDLSAGVTDEIMALAADLLDTSRAADGAGMAAVQIGVPVRMFLMDLVRITGDTIVFINPDLIDVSAETTVRKEGCLSMPGTQIEVDRPNEVRVRYTNLAGEPAEYHATGFAAQCVLHEMEHLEGRRMYDGLSPLKKAMLLKAFAKHRARGR